VIKIEDEEFNEIYGDFDKWKTAADLASLMLKAQLSHTKQELKEKLG